MFNIFRIFDFQKNLLQKRRRYKGHGPSKGAINLTLSSGNIGIYSHLDEKAKLVFFRHKGRIIGQENHNGVNFLRVITQKVIGPKGIILQAKMKDESGEFDHQLNDHIESLWEEWTKKGTVEVTGKFSWKMVQNLVLTSAARDGEVLIRLIRGLDNPFKFTLQLLESDHLNEKLNLSLSNGHVIRLGVEFDNYNRPVAYWLRKSHPSDGVIKSNLEDHERVESRDIIHLYLPERISQVRGKSWFAPVIERMGILKEYEDAELVSSRVEAGKLGFFINNNPSEKTHSVFDGQDEAGNPIMDVEPGSYRVLPKGWDIKSYDPQHPTKSFDHFVTTIMRGISCGLGISYNNFANDLEKVNYSSLRMGSLEERDRWQEIQAWLIPNFYQIVFESWLEMAFMSGKLKISWSHLEKIRNKVLWQCRGYPTVDPLKENKANVESIKFGTKTRSDVLAESGKDFHETVEQLKYEKDVLSRNGLNFEDIDKSDDVIEGDLLQ